MEQIWDAILKFTSQFVIPDWPSLISLLPVFVGVIVVLFFVRVAVAWAGAGPKRIRPARLNPTPPAGVHMPGPSFAPFFAAVGTFLLFFGLVFGGPSIILGLVALLLTLLYWGREALVDYDHVAGTHPQLPAVTHGDPPPGVHIPGPSFRPILASLAVAVLFAGLVFGGWLLGVGVVVTILTLLGWLNDARKEYHHVVDADRTGHIANEPAPGWPKVMFSLIAILVVASVALNLGWFPPRSASGAGEGGTASPAPSGAPPGAPGEISLVAEQVKFDKKTLTAPADKPFKIKFDNRDKGTPHDVDILDGSGAKVFDGKDFPGPEVKVYDVSALAAGTYKFECSIHPALMTGELTVGG
jgi:plastocyanin